MTQEEKDLLLKDICARLPYGVKADGYPWIVSEYLNGITKDRVNLQGTWINIKNIKPYLRPLSSMTEDERKDILQLLNIHGDIDNEGNLLLGVECNILTLKVCKKYLEELNKRMFDVCHMIEKGLALEAAEGIYN